MRKGLKIRMESLDDTSADNAAETPLWDGEESVMDAPALGTTTGNDGTTQLWRDAVYECCDTALWRKQLVLTPHMLLDRLKVCAELLREGQESDAQKDQRDPCVAQASQEIEHLLHLLWRGGLWTNTDPVEKVACDGQAYQVLLEPFTDGKPQGKPLSEDAPLWLKEVLGVG